MFDMKTSLKIILVCLGFLSACQKSNSSVDASGPIALRVHGSWKLEKIITPSQTKTGAQIGYEETIQSGNDQVQDYDRVFRDGKLLTTYIWSREAPIVNASDMTVTITYNEGVKRFFKIREDATRRTLEASGYLPELGTAQDSIKYFYTSQ